MCRLLGTLLLTALTLAQSPPAKKPPAKPQVLPELRLIADNLGKTDPAVRADVLLSIAAAFNSKGDHAAALKYATQALDAAQLLDRSWTQQNDRVLAVNLITSADLDAAVRLVRDDPNFASARAGIALALARKKRFDDAIDLLQSTPGGDPQVPSTALRIMSLLPAHDSRFFQTFTIARSNFLAKNFFVPGQQGMDTLLLDTADRLPPAVVLQTADELLSAAKTLDEREKTPETIEISGKHGSATFNNFYEYTAFEFLPLIRKRDPEHADALERDLTSLRALNAKYPNGLDSLAPREGDKDAYGLQDRSNDSMSFGPADFTAERSTSDRQFHDFSAAVTDLLEKDPRQAIALSARLEKSAHYRFLASVIDKYAKENPAIAHEAVAAYIKLADNETVPDCASHYVGLANHLQHDKLLDDARAVLQQSLPALAKDYDYDSGPKDPNPAPKVNWLSTALYLQALNVAQEIDPTLTPTILQSVEDHDIRLLLRVRLILDRNHVSGGHMSMVDDRRPASALRGYPLIQY